MHAAAVVRRAPPPRRHRSPPSTKPVDCGSTSAQAWPAPAREQLLQHLPNGPLAQAVKTPPARPKSQHWPQPAVAPEGPLTTWLADKQRLENMLQIEEEEHAASLRRMRQRWLEERQREAERLLYDGDEYPQTESGAPPKFSWDWRRPPGGANKAALTCMDARTHAQALALFVAEVRVGRPSEYK